MPKHHYSLWVYYPCEHRSNELDDLLTKALGRESSGGGTDFKERDMDFNFDSEAESLRGIVAIADILPAGSSVDLKHYPDLEEYDSNEIIEKTDVQEVRAKILAEQLAGDTPEASGSRKRPGL